jgi:hypothetical protein
MKQLFVNATINDRRKGKECGTQTTQFNPNRPTQVLSSDSFPHRVLPVKVMPPKKAQPSELDKMKEEILKAMRAVDTKPRPVPKSKLIGMGTVQDEPSRDYNDILAMLLAKK